MFELFRRLTYDLVAGVRVVPYRSTEAAKNTHMFARDVDDCFASQVYVASACYEHQPCLQFRRQIAPSANARAIGKDLLNPY